jgi:hypothetical protein
MRQHMHYMYGAGIGVLEQHGHARICWIACYCTVWRALRQTFVNLLRSLLIVRVRS